MTPTVSVVTPTRNRAPVLARCLDAILAQDVDPAQYEVLVADDASTDQTPEVIDEARRRARCTVRTTRTGSRAGVPATRNAAIRAAEGEIIVFVDDDSLAPPHFLAAHLRAHAAHPEGIVCRGPVIVVDDLARPFDARGGILDISTAYFDTDNGSVRRRHLLEAGLFDEAFYPYGWEGLDLGIRLRRLGLKRVFRRAAVLYHYRPHLSRGALEGLLVKEEERARTARLFYAKHPTLESRFAVQLTPLHLLLNTLQRGFGLVNASNIDGLLDRTQRWGIPAVGRVLLSGVLNERYLAHLRTAPDQAERAPTR
jgi:glycosyltransferase involved in cell wall biosynthesis